MGWSGGTGIFDCVASNTLDIIDRVSSPCLSDEVLLRRVLVPLLKVLEDKDWDNACESNYWTHPIIGKILGNTFEEEDYE